MEPSRHSLEFSFAETCCRPTVSSIWHSGVEQIAFVFPRCILPKSKRHKTDSRGLLRSG